MDMIKLKALNNNHIKILSQRTYTMPPAFLIICMSPSSRPILPCHFMSHYMINRLQKSLHDANLCASYIIVQDEHLLVFRLLECEDQVATEICRKNLLNLRQRNKTHNKDKIQLTTLLTSLNMFQKAAWCSCSPSGSSSASKEVFELYSYAQAWLDKYNEYRRENYVPMFVKSIQSPKNCVSVIPLIMPSRKTFFSIIHVKRLEIRVQKAIESYDQLIGYFSIFVITRNNASCRQIVCIFENCNA